MPKSALSDTATQDPISTFVGYLYGLYARRDNDGKARGALAELRRSAAEYSERWTAMGIVGAYIPDSSEETAVDAYLLTAELFGIYAAGGGDIPDTSRLPSYRRSLGASARSINGRRVTGNGDPVDENEGITRRFKALLALPAEDLPDELRRFLRLVRSKEAPIDFYQLLRDLLAWDHPARPVQRRWAREYWPPVPSSNDSSTTNT